MRFRSQLNSHAVPACYKSPMTNTAARSIRDFTVLPNDVEMPWLGLGTWRSADGDEVERATAAALDAGYRHIDTAAIYGNEEGVGKAIASSSVDRDDIFVTTKLWNDDQRAGADACRQAFDLSRKKLGLDVIDLYLVHWPCAGKFVEAWQVLEDLYDEGLVRALGVSNFLEHHLDELLMHCRHVPLVNQVELHPRLAQVTLRAYCAERDIQIEGWSPLMQGEGFDLPQIKTVAERHDVTPAQVMIRWGIQIGAVTIPKSVTPERIVSNADVFCFDLTDEDMSLLDELNTETRVGPHPDEITF